LRFFLLITATWAFFSTTHGLAQGAYDSTGAKRPRHYFQSQIQLDGYRKRNQDLKTNNRIGQTLETYGLRQGNLSFLIPVYTRDWQGVDKDKTIHANEHVLVTGLIHTLRPEFKGIPDHRLRKSGVGVRYIKNNGKKSVWFIEVAPFVTRDMTYKSAPYFRLASTIIYSYNAKRWLNFRMGATKSFAWGNRLYLPFIGLRIGRLDKFNVSIQFPRQATINLPVSHHWLFALYTKPQGGMYNFSNHDTLYYLPSVKTFQFTRYELNTGLRVDYRGKRLNLFLATGFCTRTSLTFYSDQKNAGAAPYRVYFYNATPGATLYSETGIVFKLGKARSIYNNTNLYDAIDLNGGNGAGDQNAQIPMDTKRQQNDLNLEEIRDLVEYDDL
jgi:hypothetical protein